MGLFPYIPISVEMPWFSQVSLLEQVTVENFAPVFVLT